MPSFQYEAVDATGRSDRGMIDADSERSARQALRARGLLPLSVRETRKRTGQGWSAGAKISDSDLGWLTRQLASLLAARLPLEAALKATLEQAERRHVAQTLAAVRDDVRAGHRLGEALAAHPRDFPEIYRALVDAGEQSGDLAQVLEKLADYIESRGALRNKVLTAFIYPIIVTIVSIGIVIFLLSYVVPQVVGAFTQAHQTLPLLTRMMLASSDFVRDWGLLTAICLAALFALWRLSLRNPAARLAWHARVLRMPVFGRYAMGVDVARFAATLAILTGSNVPLLTALDASRRTLKNRKLQAAVDEATHRVREGSPLAQALQAQKVFPPLLIHLVGSGERTGELPAMLDRAAGVLSLELERRAMTMTAVLEPLMILIMGGIVLVIVLAVMMPIIEINQLVQ
ncbi:type II secretion system inner membrane protein GspF [Pusillimonas noertemannii]|uniref:Type II secretion system protein F (GspF) n=1 Tax=Pusillimonas noertemannii TaxID=305977 RepID=A0A2U1CH57_9BURK|nr:type II secretion system inner membrane protein GspF [Pusillimonas noertemannii]NYT70635.1 type II secretion system inner membrane protein GspF [Pusillimonas noertemannii]PVY60245.1 type II secretion system protein F (GspF) [Pusillimonas noertemannii]TFL07968.1 type II secretion system protein GspF [Pusillimonas noertemannii]